MEGKLCDVTNGKMEKSDPKVFWESPSQCIYSMVLGFLTQGNDPWYLCVVFLPFLFFRFLKPLLGFFLPFLGESEGKP